MGQNFHVRVVRAVKRTPLQQEHLIPERFTPVDGSGEAIDPERIEIEYSNERRCAGCYHSHPCEHCGAYPVHLDAIIIATDGACRANGTAEARASIGVVVGQVSKYNLSELLPGSPQTSQRAELYAALRAIDQALVISEDEDFGGIDNKPHPLTEVVIKSDSEYLVKGITEWIRKWEANGYWTANGRAVVNADLFQRLVATVRMMDSRGIEVTFWHVDRRYNTEADELANRALDRLV